MLAKANTLKLRRNSIAMNQNHPADRLYLLTEGRARFFLVTSDGRKIILRWIVPGGVFGSATISRNPSSYLAGVETMHDSTLLVWTRTELRALAACIPLLLDNVIVISREYLEWYISAHVTLTTQNAAKRLAFLLIRLAESIGEDVAGGIKLDVTNEELANAANMTVFTVSRLLRAWHHGRAITKTRNRLVLQSKDLLFRTISAGRERPSAHLDR